MSGRFDGRLTYVVSGVGAFRIEADGRTVLYSLEPGAAPTDVEHFVFGPVLGLALQMQGQLVLHGGAVLHRGEAIGIIAPHGFGKSTLIASFLQAGWAALGDDLLPVSFGEGGAVYLHPGAPRVKLWPESVAALECEDEESHAVLSGSPKRWFASVGGAGELHDEPAPLAAFYCLQPTASSVAVVTVTDLPPSDAALALFANTYMADALTKGRAKSALDLAAKLVERVPVRTISYGRNFENLRRSAPR